MKPGRILGTIALATAMTLGYACGNKAEEVAPTPELTAAEQAAEQKAEAMEAYKADLAEYNAAVVEQQKQYTHTVQANEGMWDIVKQYADGPVDATLVDMVCMQNDLTYLSGDALFVRDFDMYPDARFTPTYRDGKQDNCQLLYEGQTLDFSYFAPKLEKPVMPN